MELLFGISYTNKDDVIYMLVNPETGIPEADFNVSTLDEEGNPTGQVEIIGWLYQYYNTELKDDTFAKLKKNVKITKERIPAATQLFTPDWIVRYMVENSVGRIWIEHLRAVDPSTDEKATAERFGWKYYLPEAEQEESVNVKLAEIRTTYKDLKPTDITCIDPCMGSGHILIAMFDVLMDIYESAGYDKREAAFEIVEHNIHGLDIDQRAYQLAYFAVMMKGRGYNRRFLRGRDGKPEPKVYAIVESNEINRNHLKFFGTHLSEMERNLAVMQIEGLLDTFKDAREYGSILNVDACDWDVLERFVDDLGTTGQISFESVGSEETREQLRKLVRVAKNLGEKYDAVVTNPPYMGNKGMNSILSEYVKKKYSDSKNDLFAVFLERCEQFLKKYAYQAMITQHAWMFLSGYEKLRSKLLAYSFVNMLHLGPRAFEEIGGEIVQTTSFIIKKCNVEKYKGVYYRLVDPVTQKGKEKMYLQKRNKYEIEQDSFFEIPGKCFSYWLSARAISNFSKGKQLKEIAEIRQGLATSDNNRFLRLWNEVNYNHIDFNSNNTIEAKERNFRWFPFNKGGEYRKWYGNQEYIVDYLNDGKAMKDNVLKKYPYLSTPDFVVKNTAFYFLESITWTEITSSTFGVRYCPPCSIFSNKSNSIFPKTKDELYYLIGVLCSKPINLYIKALNPTITTNVGDVAKVPIIYKDSNGKILELVKTNIFISKKEWDSYETSWEFLKHPLIEVTQQDGKQENRDLDTKIQECYKRWEKESSARFERIRLNEQQLNQFFIDIYGLQDELTPEVEDKDVTVRKADLSRDIRSFISYAVGCMFGRYSLDEEGLIYAGGEWDSSRYKTFFPDDDNCIPITDEEYFPDDIVTRFVEFVKIVYGAETLEENLDFIADALGNKGDTSREVIRNYFLKDFYADHLKVYQKRPIYWPFDSGKQNGFKALIYMHRYDADTVGRVRTDYLHRAQRYVETAMQSALYTIDNASSASEKSKATKAVTKYTKQLAEMKIYDEAIAHIANKRIEIDLDDGVKVNYEKFQGVEVAQEGKKALKVDLLAKLK